MSINVLAFPGAPSAPAEQIAAAYWGLHNKQEDGEFIFRT